MSPETAHGPSAPRGHFLENLVLFARLLRVGEIDLTPEQLVTWLRAIQAIDPASKEDFKAASRAALTSHEGDHEWFDPAFELFFQARDPRELQELEMGLLVQRQTKKSERLAAADQASGESSEPIPLPSWSDREVLRDKDFAEMTNHEVEQVKQLIRQLGWRLETRTTRRTRRSRRGHELDLRQSLRKARSTDAEIIHLFRKKRRQRSRPLVLICDISGSMEPYSRLLLHFVYAITHSKLAGTRRTKVESFVFGTKLTRVTPFLASQHIDSSLEQVQHTIDDWGGGTKTGECLKEFNFNWGRRVLNQGAIVLIISDGWDRGDVDLLGCEMARVSRSCSRLIWLNPLLGSPRYQPLTRGIRAALPHVTDFLPVHNLRSLEQLGELLDSLRRR